MTLAYVKPGVSVQEIVNPTFVPQVAEPTNICIIGPATGFESRVENVQLVDRVPVSLSVPDGVDLNRIVVTSADGTTIYTQGTATGTTLDNGFKRPNGDYYISGNQIIRTMQTLIDSGQEVFVYYEVDPDGGGTKAFQELVTLTESSINNAETLTAQGDNTNTQITGISVQAKGVISDVGNYNIVLSGIDGSGVPTHTQTTITVTDGDIFLPNSQQTVYIDFTDKDGLRHYDVAVKVSGSTPVAIPGYGDGVGPDPRFTNSVSNANIVVKNVTGQTVTTQAVVYNASDEGDALGSNADGENNQGADYAVSHGTGTSYVIYRPAGVRATSTTVTTKALDSGDTVVVSYDATPSDYYVPTRCLSQSDVEDKYGAALDSGGNVVSPVSFAASLAFSNGAPDIVIQALFHEVQGVRTPGGLEVDTGDAVADWRQSLVSLRDIEDVNVLVPIVSADGNPGDERSLLIFEAIQDHIAFMIDQNHQYLVGICGEDSTVGTNLASKATLQSAAKTLGVRKYGETMTLISPAAFQFANPTTGAATALGGQYVAAAAAGRLASLPIAQTLTRQQLIGIVAVTDARSEADKDSDAEAGLFVVEARGGVIRVRHALTTNGTSAATRELSVIRAKHYMIESVRQTIDNQVIGRIVADDRAAFTVQLLVQDTLDQLVTEGAIVTYQDTSARLTSLDPTLIEVRFSYSPSFPLNYVNVVFSINTANGVVTATDTQGL